MTTQSVVPEIILTLTAELTQLREQLRTLEETHRKEKSEVLAQLTPIDRALAALQTKTAVTPIAPKREMSVEARQRIKDGLARSRAAKSIPAPVESVSGKKKEATHASAAV